MHYHHPRLNLPPNHHAHDVCIVHRHACLVSYAVNPICGTLSMCHLYACAPFTHEASGPACGDSEALVSGDVTAQKSLMTRGTDDSLKPSMHN